MICVPFHAVISYLLDIGADVNASDSGGETPLHYAARSGSEETTKELLKSRHTDLEVE